MSRQNSREVSSLEVTLNGSQVNIEPFANGTKPFDDVKVLLLKGASGNGIVSIEKTGTSGNVDTYTITYDNGDTDTFTVTNGIIEQVQSDYSQSNTSAVDYIKNKPTLGTASAKDVPSSGDASTTQVVMGDDSRLTNSRRNPYRLDVELRTYVGSGGVSMSYYGNEEKKLIFRRQRRTITASNWSSVANASGYYTYICDLTYSFDENYVLKITPYGADGATRPTSIELSAYRNICTPNGYVDHTAKKEIKLYAKTKPTATFYILVDGIAFED